jgi:hypothetical protein
MLSVNYQHLWLGNPQKSQRFGKDFPGEAFPLPSSAVQPFECTLFGPAIKMP